MGSGFLGNPTDGRIPEIRPPNFQEQGRQMAQGAKQAGFVVGLLAGIGQAVNDAVEYLALAAVAFAGTIMTGVMRVVHSLQVGESGVFREFLVLALSEVFDMPFNADLVQFRADTGGQAGLRRELGRQMLENLLTRAGGVSPPAGVAEGGAGGEEGGAAPAGRGISPGQGVLAAEALLGYVIGWEAKSAFLSVVTEAATGGQFDQMATIFQEIGVDVDIGNISRSTIGPMLGVAVREPWRWALNAHLRPTDLSPSQAIDLWARHVLTREEMRGILVREGYPDPWISALMATARRELGVGDLERLLRWGNLDGAAVRSRLQRAGYDAAEADLLLGADTLQKRDAHEQQMVATINSLLLDGFLDPDQQLERLKALHLKEQEVADIRAITGTRLEFSYPELSLAQLEDMVIEGVADITEYQGYLQRKRYRPRDQQLLVMRLRLRMAESTAREEAKRLSEERKKLREEERKRRQAEAEERRRIAEARPKLTLAEIREAFFTERIGQDELQSFLEREGYEGRDLELQLQDAVEDKAQIAEQRRRAEELRALAGTRKLSLAEAEAAYVAGLLEREEFAGRVAQVLPEERDQEILLLSADTARRAREARDAEEDARRREVKPPLLSVEQEINAYARGVVTRERLGQLFELERFDGEGIRILLAEADERKAAVDAARTAAEAERLLGPVPRLSLEQEVAAFVSGVLDQGRLERFFIAERLGPEERGILLQRALSEREAHLSRQAELDRIRAQVPPPRLTVDQESRAFVEGTITVARFGAFLRSEGYSPEEQVILMATASRERAEFLRAEDERRRRGEPPPPRRLSRQDAETAFVQGEMDAAAYGKFLTLEGYKDPEHRILLALAVRRRRELEARRREQEEREQAPEQPRITLAQMESAVIEGIADLDEFAQFLEAERFTVREADILTQALLLKLARRQ